MSATAGPAHVLYVDDYAPMCELAAEALEEAGFRVTVCHDAQSAMAIVERCPGRVDAAVADYNLPATRGDELARRLLAVAGFPVVIVSGAFDANMRSLALQAGASAVIDKAAVYADLPALLRKLLSAKGT